MMYVYVSSIQASSWLAHIATLTNVSKINKLYKAGLTYMAEILLDGGVVGFSYNALANSYSSRPPCFTACR